MQQFPNQMFANGGNPGQFANQAGGMGYGGTLSQYGSNPQMVRQQIAGAPQAAQQPQQSMMGNNGPQGNPGAFASTQSSPMHAGATNPQEVRQNIAQDLGYSQMRQPMQQSQQNPMQQMQQQPMHQAQQQPMQQSQQPMQQMQQPQQSYQGYQGIPYDQHAFAQMMQNQGQQQPFGSSNYAPQGQQPQGALAEFGTPVQNVRQDINQDLNRQIGSMTSQQAGAYRNAQPMGAQQQFASQQGQPTSMLAQYGTNPQTVREHIQQDMQRFQ